MSLERPELEMNLLPLVEVQRESWEQLLEEWGGGLAVPRYIYGRDCTQSGFPDHKVLRGPGPAGGLTDSGFLVNRSGEVVGGVDAINATR